MLLSVTTLAEHERGLVIVELTEMVEHERKIATTAALAPSPCRADPATPDPLQRLAAEDGGGCGSARCRPTASARARGSVLLGQRRSGSSGRRRCWRLVALLHLGGGRGCVGRVCFGQ